MRNKIFFYFLGLILAGMASATWALAQPLAQPGEGFRGAGSGGFQERFQQVKRTQMGPALGVNQQTVDQLLQVEQRYQQPRGQLTQDMQTDYQHLQQAMSQPAPSEQQVGAILGDMKRKRQEMQDLQIRQGQEEEALLTPVQQARYLMYNRSLLSEARSVKRGGPGETGPYTPEGPRELPVINRSMR